MAKTVTFIVKKEEEGISLNKFLLSSFDCLELDEVAALFKGSVLVNGQKGDPGLNIKEHDSIEVALNDSLVKKMDLECSIGDPSVFASLIVYEDDNLLILNKPQGLLVQRNIAYGPSLESYARAYILAKGSKDKLSSAHRLDRGTSGLVIFGKNPASLSSLGIAFMEKGKIEKKYWALAKGEAEEKGEILTPLAKDYKTGIVSPCPLERGGKPCSTFYQKIKSLQGYSLLEVTLGTGRTHQIRAHLLSIGHPIVGDPKYGDEATNLLMKEKYGLTSQFLHAHSLSFQNMPSPLSYLDGQEFSAPLPQQEEKALEDLTQTSIN